MNKMTDKDKKLHIRAVLLLILSMVAVAMMSEVAKQNWHSKVTAYPTKSETYIADRAKEILGGMTVEEKVGQMLFVRCSEEYAQEAVEQFGFGGFLLYDDDFEGKSKTEVIKYIAQLQTVSRVPMLIGVDEEGGTVNRISRFKALRSTPFLSPSELMRVGGMTLVHSETSDKCDLLTELGINVNFAPVCDVATDADAFIYDRALGKDADATARYVAGVVKVMDEKQVVGVLKHFPGYGNLTARSDTAVAVDDGSIENYETVNALPFAAGIEAGADAVLTGHIVATALDDERPASLSKAVHNRLRRELGFDGVIVCDSLTASGLEAYGTADELVAMAVDAGNDLLVTTAYKTHYEALLRAVRQGRISEQRLDESVVRILKLKIEYGMIS